MITLGLLVAVGAFLCLDRTQLLQVMISRPIVIGPVFGAWAGEPMLGAAIGMALEFLYAGRLPVGSHVPPNDTFAALGAAGLLVYVPETTGLAETGAAVALALPLAEVGRGIDIWVRKANGVLARRLDRRLAQGDWSALERTPWVAVTVAYGIYALALAFFYPIAGLLLRWIAAVWPVWLENVFVLFLGGLPLIGLAESAANLDPRRFPKPAVIGLALGIVLLMLVV